MEAALGEEVRFLGARQAATPTPTLYCALETPQAPSTAHGYCLDGLSPEPRLHLLEVCRTGQAKGVGLGTESERVQHLTLLGLGGPIQGMVTGRVRGSCFSAKSPGHRQPWGRRLGPAAKGRRLTSRPGWAEGLECEAQQLSLYPLVWMGPWSNLGF